MKLKSNILLIFSLGILLFFLAGCNATEDVVTLVESGTMNESYKGDPDPVVPKEILLSEEEKANGIQKIKIKCGVEIDAPVQQKEEVNEEQVQPGGDSGAKPKI